MSRIQFWLPLCAAAALAGCGRSKVGEVLQTFPVSGLVTVNGHPASGVSVTFLPVGGTRGQGGYAVTGEGGRFTVMSADGSTGVPEGDYKVLVSKWTLPDGSPIPAGSTAADVGAENQLPELYSDPGQSPALAKVLSGANPDIMVDVKTRNVARR